MDFFLVQLCCILLTLHMSLGYPPTRFVDLGSRTVNYVPENEALFNTRRQNGSLPFVSVGIESLPSALRQQLENFDHLGDTDVLEEKTEIENVEHSDIKDIKKTPYYSPVNATLSNERRNIASSQIHSTGIASLSNAFKQQLKEFDRIGDEEDLEKVIKIENVPYYNPINETSFSALRTNVPLPEVVGIPSLPDALRKQLEHFDHIGDKGDLEKIIEISTLRKNVSLPFENTGTEHLPLRLQIEDFDRTVDTDNVEKTIEIKEVQNYHPLYETSSSAQETNVPLPFDSIANESLPRARQQLEDFDHLNDIDVLENTIRIENVQERRK